MTKIYNIHGIAKDELPGRGLEVGKTPAFVPYTRLTKGEFRLSLLMEQAAIYRAAYPEAKEFQQAENLLYNALKNGVSRGVNFVGALDSPLLQSVAKSIQEASRATAPASKTGMLGRDPFATGLQGIGDFKADFDHDCVQYATKLTNAKYKTLFPDGKSWQYYERPLLNDAPTVVKEFYKTQKALCKVKIEVEAIINQKITDASHHVLYFGLNESFPLIKNSLVQTKHLFHIGGIQGLANAADIDKNLMGLWTETSILRKNSTAGVGVSGSINSSFLLSPDPEKFNVEFLKWQKVRGGGSVNGVQVPAVGSVAAITALIVAIGAAVASAAEMQRRLNEKRTGAMSAAQNYGTVAFESKQSDFNEPPASTGSSNNNLLIFGAAAAAGLYLMSEE